MSYMPYHQYPVQQRSPYPVQPPPTYQHPQPRYPVHYQNQQQFTRPPQPSQSPQRPPVQPRQPAPPLPVKQPSQFPELEKLNEEELQALLENEDKVNDIVKELESIQNKKLTKEMCLAENRSLAEFNLSREPRFTEGRQKLARSYEKNQQLRSTFEQHMASLSIMSSKHSLDSVLALLQASTSQAEDDSEKIADEFLDGKTEVDDFVEEFRAKRIVYNLKKTKSEELKKLILQSQRTTPYSQQTTNPPQTAPYPTPYSLNRGYPGQPQMSGYNSSQYMPQLSMPTIGSYPR